MANRRSTKFYRKNEEEVMNALGFKPTKNSGAGFTEKEDGQNEYLICQLKSTDAKSISVRQQDLHTLEYNAIVSHKTPVFAIQFLNTDEVWIMCKPEDITQVSEYIKTGKCDTQNSYSVNSILDIYNNNIDNKESKKNEVVKIKSSSKARERFHEEQKQKYRKDKKAW